MDYVGRGVRAMTEGLEVFRMVLCMYWILVCDSRSDGDVESVADELCCSRSGGRRLLVDGVMAERKFGGGLLLGGC